MVTTELSPMQFWGVVFGIVVCTTMLVYFTGKTVFTVVKHFVIQTGTLIVLFCIYEQLSDQQKLSVHSSAKQYARGFNLLASSYVFTPAVTDVSDQLLLGPPEETAESVMITVTMSDSDTWEYSHEQHKLDVQPTQTYFDGASVAIDDVRHAVNVYQRKPLYVGSDKYMADRIDAINRMSPSELKVLRDAQPSPDELRRMLFPSLNEHTEMLMKNLAEWDDTPSPVDQLDTVTEETPNTHVSLQQETTRACKQYGRICI